MQSTGECVGVPGSVWSSWSSWSPWGTCSTSCGDGVVTRQRVCMHESPGNTCQGKTAEIILCSAIRELVKCGELIHYEYYFISYFPICLEPWDDWSDWEKCTVTCGEGSMVRNRECLFGYTCQGNSKQAISCFKDLCRAYKTLGNSIIIYYTILYSLYSDCPT